jgi:hypothetical protein
MSEAIVRDGYEEAAAAKLWPLLPEVYRNDDSAVLDAPGPLQELLSRIAVQVATVRRSLDRLWDDQSIESCDDWVIPYIAALVDTNLVPAMDARGQRLDVANTINYRRRKGTLGLIEELTANVTGWESRAVEFFRALGRYRHGLDPAIGWPADSSDPAGARTLQHAERLVGLLTGTPAGGFADIRSAAGAAATGTAFDEFHHFADVRRGEGALGWYGIPKVGIFLWRSVSLSVDRGTPVPVASCPGTFAFDPTGRQIPLFQADDRAPDGYGENWAPLAEWQVPGPLTQEVYDAVRAAHEAPPPKGAWPDPKASFWPETLSVTPVGAGVQLDEDEVLVWPEVGRFKLVGAANDDVEVGYHYGLFSRIGAGPYDRRQLQQCDHAPPTVDPLPVTTADGGSAIDLANALAALGPVGTVVVTDGLTSTAVSPVGSPAAPIQDVTMRAADERRAVIRLAAGDSPWVFQGSTAPGSADARLRLEGLLVAGQDVVLRGGFHEVVLSCCTFDPGTRGDLRTPPTVWEPAVDGRPLSATRLWIEGTVRTLTIDRCILGPIRTRQGGVTETIAASDSVVQGLPSTDGTLIAGAGVFDADGLFRLLNHKRDALTTWLAAQLGATAAGAVAGHADGTPVADADLTALLGDLNTLVDGPTIWDPARFADRQISPTTIALAESGPTGDDLKRLNHLLLTEAFPLELQDAALATGTGLTKLSRCTILGCGYVHRIESSESILDDVVLAGDAQDGCVRFSAWSAGSLLPRKYECVHVAPGAPLFVTRRFGEWGYAELADGCDAAILSASTAGTPSIREGSHDGSEMGVFCRDAAAVKEHSLLIKLDEFLPVGLTPVLIPLPTFDAEAETTRGRPWPST